MMVSGDTFLEFWMDAKVYLDMDINRLGFELSLRCHWREYSWCEIVLFIIVRTDFALSLQGKLNYPNKKQALGAFYFIRHLSHLHVSCEAIITQRGILPNNNMSRKILHRHWMGMFHVYCIFLFSHPLNLLLEVFLTHHKVFQPVTMQTLTQEIQYTQGICERREPPEVTVFISWIFWTNRLSTYQGKHYYISLGFSSCKSMFVKYFHHHIS